jgi:hypothetical protein
MSIKNMLSRLLDMFDFSDLKLTGKTDGEQRRENYFRRITDGKLDFEKRYGRQPNESEVASIDGRVQRECGVRVTDSGQGFVYVNLASQ